MRRLLCYFHSRQTLNRNVKSTKRDVPSGRQEEVKNDVLKILSYDGGDANPRPQTLLNALRSKLKVCSGKGRSRLLRRCSKATTGGSPSDGMRSQPHDTPDIQTEMARRVP
jgi:hypothetical protein